MLHTHSALLAAVVCGLLCADLVSSTANSVASEHMLDNIHQQLSGIQQLLQVIHNQNQMLLDATFGPDAQGSVGVGAGDVEKRASFAYGGGMRGRRGPQFWGIRG